MLPGHKWLRADTGRYIPGGRFLRVRRQLVTTPLFLREGNLVPFQPGERTTNRKDLKHIGLLCCLFPEFSGRARLFYRADDRLSFDYRRGRRTRLDVTARIKGRRLHLRVKTIAEGLGRVHLVPFSVNRFTALHLENDGREQRLHPIKERAQLAGRPFD